MKEEEARGTDRAAHTLLADDRFVKIGCARQVPTALLSLMFLAGCIASSTGSAMQANGPSYSPSISGDGRWVAFASEASNLTECDTNGRSDVFLHDRQTGRTERVSVGMRDTQANDASYEPALSAGGRWLAFSSWASNLAPADTNGSPDVFLYNRSTGHTELVSKATDGHQPGNASSGAPRISADGRWLAFLSSAKCFLRNLAFQVGIWYHYAN